MPTTIPNGLLLDTRALLWAVMDPDKLGPNALLVITADGALSNGVNGFCETPRRHLLE
jgi:hypothetical protein